jgi:bisphosphoglycerate-dependent phosphoglycerate mutase
VARVVAYWADVLAEQLFADRTVLVVGHGNSLRTRRGHGSDGVRQDPA